MLLFRSVNRGTQIHQQVTSNHLQQMEAGCTRGRGHVGTRVAAEMENLQILIHNYARMGIVAPDNAVGLFLQVRRRRGRLYGFAWLCGSIMAGSGSESGIVGCRSLAIKLPLLLDQGK